MLKLLISSNQNFKWWKTFIHILFLNFEKILWNLFYHFANSPWFHVTLRNLSKHIQFCPTNRSFQTFCNAAPRVICSVCGYTFSTTWTMLEIFIETTSNVEDLKISDAYSRTQSLVTVKILKRELKARFWVLLLLFMKLKFLSAKYLLWHKLIANELVTTICETSYICITMSHLSDFRVRE